MENNEATISDDVREKFFWFGVTALSKALVFRTLAKQTFENREYILTSISGYYSLFHLAMAIMYLCPQLLSDKQLKGILKAIEKTGGLDPSEGGYRFRHKEALNFIGKCGQKV